ncbi:hypothetical protein A2U01_0113584 [Trifolium medium]|uniref:Uncharacterized protein n=1 Tax=Trifolium medium TaxID=97028 RepID=A0A392VV57_9FABA|nr:hypothetical protein [Trifolium medium]
MKERRTEEEDNRPRTEQTARKTTEGGSTVGEEELEFLLLGSRSGV